MRVAGVGGVVGVLLVFASLPASSGDDNPLLTVDFDTTVADTGPATTAPETTVPTEETEPPASSATQGATTSIAAAETSVAAATTAAGTTPTAPPTTLAQLTLAEVGAALHAPVAAYIQSRGREAETEALRVAAQKLLDSGRADALPAVRTPDGQASASVLLEFLAAQPDFIWIKLLEVSGVLSGLPVFFLDGVYRVGPEVLPGSYEALDVEYCFWQRIDAQGRQIDSFYTELAPRATATIVPSDYGFASKSCGIWFRLG
jgi:hypothetical protein